MMMMQMLMTTMMYTSILALSATTLSQEEVDFEEGSTKSSRFTWQVITKGGNRLQLTVQPIATWPVITPFFFTCFIWSALPKLKGPRHIYSIFVLTLSEENFTVSVFHLDRGLREVVSEKEKRAVLGPVLANRALHHGERWC